MKVLVTGAAGFLGGHVVARLAARGDRVVALDREAPATLPARAEAVRAEVTDREAVARAAEGCEGVVHAAAITGLWCRDPADFERVNAGGTRTVLSAASEAGVARAVLVSSYVTVISGGRSRRATVTEDEELPSDALLGPYPRSKRLAELAAREARVPTAIVLPSAPLGPGDRGPTPPGAMLTDLANGRLPALIDTLWAFVDVRALADGVIAALDRGEAGRRYLMTGEAMDTDAFLELFERVAGVAGPRARVPWGVALAAARVSEAVSAVTGRPPGAPVTGVRLAGPRLSFDCARAREELDFRPPPIESALRDALLWLRAEGRIARDLPGLPPAQG